MWITGMFSDDFRIEKGVFSEVPTSQKPDKTMVFIKFQIFIFFNNLMVSGTSWDLILEVWEVLRVHFHDSWRYLRLLEISMNFIVFPETPQAEAIQSGGGKSLVSRAHYYRQLGGYSIQNTTHSMKHCHTGSEDVNVRCKCKCKWCMKQYAPQPGGPWQAGAGGYVYMYSLYTHTCTYTISFPYNMCICSV